MIKKILCCFIVGFLITNYMLAQNPGIDMYQMQFRFKDNNQIEKDTIMTQTLLYFWIKSGNFPSVVKWVNRPFNILKQEEQVGVFTDSVKNYSQGDTIGIAFYKKASVGIFGIDFLKTNLFHLVRDSDNPSMSIISTSKGLIFIAKQNISNNTELTYKHKDLITLFPDAR